jgi:hypothetical protein
MSNDGRSSLQKAAAMSSSSSSLSIASSQSGRGSNGKNRDTETSFEVGASVARPPVAASGGVKTSSAHTISGSSYTVGEDRGATAVVAGTRRSSKQTTKNTKHFTIISAHDEQQHNGNSESAMDVDHHHEVNHGGIKAEDTVGMSLENRQPSLASITKTQTFLQIGGFQEERKIDNAIDVPLACDDDNDDRLIEQMEGVIDQGSKMPLVVLDGANVAYAYANVMAGKNNSSLDAASSVNSKTKVEPDVRGIQIATDFFLEAGIRVLVVLPQYWFRENNSNRSTTTAMTFTPQLEILSDLKAKGLIVASPPTDDDDAYALTISRREEKRRRAGICLVE